MNFAIIGSVILGIISILYYVIIVTYVKTFGGFALVWLLLGVFFLFLSFALKHNILQMIFKNKKINIVIICLLVLGFSLFIVIESVITYNANKSPDSEIEYLVILGARVDKKSITTSLRDRLDIAIEYIEEHKDIKVVVSGGQGPTEDITEAAAMRDYLVEHGVDSDIIIMEDKSTNTKENMEFTKNIIGSDKKIIVVSNGFHMFRATKLAESQGFVEVQGLAARTDRRLLINLYVREVFGVAKDYMAGNIKG